LINFSLFCAKALIGNIPIPISISNGHAIKNSKMVQKTAGRNLTKNIKKLIIVILVGGWYISSAE
jgi:hypothetical protein